MLYTLSAVQVLALSNQLHRVNAGKVAKYVSSLQQPDGSFFGDKWGEVDTRFSYCALSTMSILGRLNSGDIDVQKAVEYVGRFSYQIQFMSHKL
jgi:geranylgeranyl transferase type-2 subunit beta